MLLNFPIRRTLIFYFAFFAFVPLAIVVFVALNAVNRSAHQQAAEQRSLVAEVKISDIESWLKTARGDIELILVDPVQQQRVVSLVNVEQSAISSSRPITIRNVERFLKQQLQSQSVFSEIFIYNLDGEVVLSTASDDEDTNISDKVYFADIFARETLIHAISFNDGSPELVVTTPIVDEDSQVWGNVVGVLNLEVLDEILLESLGTSQTSEVYLVNSEGLVVAPFSETLAIGSTVKSEAIEKALAGKNGVSNYPNYSDVSVVGAYRWLPNMQVALIAEISESEALAVSTEIQRLSLIVSGLAIAIVVLTGTVGAQQLTRPIGILTDTASAVIAGDLDQQAKVNSRNEIGQLANAFNEMTSRLRNLIDTLEQRVASRTKELEAAREEAENASHAKSIFLSNMSHELRTPLNMVIGYTTSMLHMPQMYNGETLPQIFRDDVDLILQSGQHLLGLINDILDLSKIEAGKFSLNMASVDMNEIFQGVVATATGLVNNKPIQLRTDYSHQLPHVWGDKIRIRQILLNLLSNAIKYTEAGVVTLHARVDETSLYIEVKDTGLGIPQSMIATIFDRFEQARFDSNTQGTGLGLDISQRLAEMHGSSINIESEVGKGSTFSFTLALSAVEGPIKHGDERVIEQIETLEHEDTIVHLVLLAETSAENRQHIHATITEPDYVIADLQEDDDILDYASTLMPDAVILGKAFAKDIELVKNLQTVLGASPIFVIDTEIPQYPVDVHNLPHFNANLLLDKLNLVLKTPQKESER